ncbi:MAG: transcription elongation factor GreA [Clostridiales Family XIII bacterium]|jgi:transcription elongation factor GreA|nr:transcription elongation factor GreA [Clostridiales Family XIII bacterium]
MNEETREITKEDFKKLRIELKHLKTDGRADIAEKLKIARSYGDLSENAEYDAAKDEQLELETKIAKIETILKNVKIIGTRTKTDIVRPGLTITIKNTRKKNDEKTFKLVGLQTGLQTADNEIKKISIDSPIGKAVNGKKVEDEIIIETPRAKQKYIITKIE